MNNQNFPEQFLENMRLQLGAEYEEFLQAMCAGGSASRALRVNPLRAQAEKAAQPFVESRVPWAEWGRYVHADSRPGAALAHFSGAYYMQEASAMSAAAVLNAQPGERVLDLCAAPGGKSTQLAGAMLGRGLLVSNEPEPSRAKALAGNLERLGVPNAIVTNAYPNKLSACLKGYFDAILVDAPCSGEGMFARDEAARAEWTPASPEGCARRQSEILEEAAKMLRPGGRMVYSTCTFNDVENEGVVRDFLASHEDFSLIPFVLPGIGAAENGTLHVYPHRVRGDGHFIALLRREGEAPCAPAPAFANKKEHAALLKKLLDEAVCALPFDPAAVRLEMYGEYLYALPAEAPELRGVKVVQPGLCLLHAGRNHIEPAHALAMALPESGAQRSAELAFPDACAYCEGQTLPLDAPRGWTLVTHNGLPLGWGKIANEQLKNHLPKGLRRKFYDE